MAFILEVGGDFACFTRPEFKVERMSYPVLTPSAARNILQAIMWKPAIEWYITKIEVLKPIKWFNIKRNEVKDIITAKDNPIIIEESRQVRASMVLKDVKYRIHAYFAMTNKAGKGDNANKFAAMFKRRVENGQCFTQPYLGTREFSCYFEFTDSDLTCKNESKPITLTENFGYVLYDIDFSNPEKPSPLFFNLKMDQGVIDIPPRDSKEVK